MGHLSQWLTDLRLDGSQLTGPRVDTFLAQRRDAGSTTGCTHRALAPLLEYLREAGAAPLSEPVHEVEVTSDTDVLLLRYAEYLHAERGLAPTTIQNHVHRARSFLMTRDQDGRVDLSTLTADEVIAVVLDTCRDAAGRSMGPMVGSLRSLLRFLHVEGAIDQPLATVVPSSAAWKLTALPKALTGEQVTALFDSCDQSTIAGRRDFAILTILSRLGLRAGEVADLKLIDVDWRRGEITVRGKGNRCEQLPLPHDVGEAIVAYLSAGHPGAEAGAGAVFVRVKAPHGPMTRGAVTAVAARAARRSGLDPMFAHRLRHTAATQMLLAGGSLPEIGQVLRHHRAATTAIYAKVDTETLRQLARPWPGTPA
jgi:site-specific recombinase XerD